MQRRSRHLMKSIAAGEQRGQRADYRSLTELAAKKLKVLQGQSEQRQKLKILSANSLQVNWIMKYLYSEHLISEPNYPAHAYDRHLIIGYWHFIGCAVFPRYEFHVSQLDQQLGSG